MSVDISGVIELRGAISAGSPEEWIGIINLEQLVERNYGIFGALFGVRNSDGFIAAFPDRGLPLNLSREASTQFELAGEGAVRATWALWREIQAVNWEQIGAQEHTRIISAEAWRGEQLNPQFVIESSAETPSGSIVRRHRKDHPELGVETITPDEEPTAGTFVQEATPNASKPNASKPYVRTAHYSIREVMSRGWQACFDVMRALAKHYGDDSVRLVVWFDSE